MRIGVLGVNFKSADIAIREGVSRACQEQLSSLNEVADAYTCVILSTCNRVEIYFSASDLASAHSEILNALKKGITFAFEHRMYSYFGGDCFLHLAQVTAGMDSAILAEGEIQRQVKCAYERAVSQYKLPSVLHYLFQKSLQMGKYIRSHFSLSQNQVTIPKILFEITSHRFNELENMPLLFIGNSEINRSLISYFKNKGLCRMTLCSRSLSTEQAKISLLPWDKLSSWVEFPLVICGSNSPQHLITEVPKGSAAELIIDLSIPRMVDPSVAHVTLLNMEALIHLIEIRQQRNEEEMARAEMLLLTNIHKYVETFSTKEKRVHAWV